MPRFAANLSLMFTEVPFLERFGAAAAAGFSAVEFQFPYAYSVEDIVKEVNAHHLQVVLFNAPPGDFAKAGERGIAALPGRERAFEQSFAQALIYARALHCPRIHVMAGLIHQGATREVFVRNLKNATILAALEKITVLVEPINTRDIPGYLINRTTEALAVMTLVAEANIKLQLDLYHRQIMEGDLTGAVDEFAAVAGHVQIAQPPDRGEPDHGEINFQHVLATLDATGYLGWVGCEYKPRRETSAGLGWLDAYPQGPGR